MRESNSAIFIFCHYSECVCVGGGGGGGGGRGEIGS